MTIPRAILVPVDGSNFAEHALPYGLAIARRTGATLHLVLVHVPAEVPAPAYPLAEAIELRLLEDRGQEAAYMDALVDRLAPGGVTIRPARLGGHVAHALSHYVEENEIDVVAMTTHGRGGLQRAWLGSTTDGMVRQCGVPLLLMRPSDQTRDIGPSSDASFHSIVAALDGSETAERALASALRLGITADAMVLLLHVMPPGVAAAAPYLPHTIQLTHDELVAREAHHKTYVEGVAGSAALAGRTVQTRLLVDYEPAAAILDVAEAEDADLIVVGTHGRGGLRRMLLGSVADKVIRGTHRAVLVHRGAGRLARAGAVTGRVNPLAAEDEAAPGT